MTDEAEILDKQLGRIREILKVLELHAESMVLSGEADVSQQGARLAILADGGGHIWQASEPEGSDYELAEVVDAVIEHLTLYRDRLRRQAGPDLPLTH